MTDHEVDQVFEVSVTYPRDGRPVTEVRIYADETRGMDWAETSVRADDPTVVTDHWTLEQPWLRVMTTLGGTGHRARVERHPVF